MNLITIEFTVCVRERSLDFEWGWGKGTGRCFLACIFLFVYNLYDTKRTIDKINRVLGICFGPNSVLDFFFISLFKPSSSPSPLPRPKNQKIAPLSSPGAFSHSTSSPLLAMFSKYFYTDI